MRTANRVAQRYFLRLSMSLQEAKAVLGFPPDASPSDSEVARAWKTKAFENHPDRGGDPKKMVELNVAKDLLQGKGRPTPSQEPSGWGWGGPPPGSYQDTAPPPRQPPPPPQPDKVITFNEAKSKANIPSDVEWVFVTDVHSSGYSSDEMTNRATGWIAAGKIDSGKGWVFVSAEHYDRAYYYVGGGPKTDTWNIETTKIHVGDKPTAAAIYGGVVKAWDKFHFLEKKFNSKVVPVPTDWSFSNKTPTGRATTIKNLLLDSGAMEESELATPRKYTIELQYVRAKMTEEAPPGYFKPKYRDPMQLVLIVNGKDFTLSETSTEKVTRLRVGGKDFMERVFGQYHYGGEVKNLTRNRDGKAIMKWMSEHLTDLPEAVSKALLAASV